MLPADAKPTAGAQSAAGVRSASVSQSIVRRGGIVRSSASSGDHQRHQAVISVIRRSSEHTCSLYSHTFPFWGTCAPSAATRFLFWARVLPQQPHVSFFGQVCSLCSEPLVSPTRMQSCRHVLCTKCVDVTVSYFRECPTCSSTLTAEGGTVSDITHARLLALRYSTLKSEPCGGRGSEHCSPGSRG